MFNLNNLKASMPNGLKSDLSPRALEKWNPNLLAESEEENTISILDVIGEDWFTGEGVTSKRISAALRSIGSENDVTVYVNSPGGDMFEGLAIYSLLKEHKGKVTIKVLSLAASAASIIAMAGDEIQISRAAFFMIHNAWIVAAGNRNDFKEYSEYLEPFDMAMADVYFDRTGISKDEIISMMDSEAWIGGAEAVEIGFAASIMSSEPKEDETKTSASSIRKIDNAMAKAGVTRSERRKLLKDLKSSCKTGDTSPDAGVTNTPSAIEPLPRVTFKL